MFKKFTAIFLYVTVLMLFINVASAQKLQLFLEDFNGGNSFTLNSGGPSSNTGSNKWTVNNSYIGNGTYPNTPSEKNTTSGIITYPDSNYLHIYDVPSAPGVQNCEYNNNVASDNFAYMGGFCTLGFTNVHFSFFWICEGGPSDYGTVYYSLDGGAWTPCGQVQYNNQSLWKYEDISLAAFNNHANVRFGFRWQDSGGGGANKIAFGIDDVIAVGDQDNINPPTITITSTAPNPVCEEGAEVIFFQLSQPLCDGTYQVFMSDANGNFGNPTPLGGTVVPAGSTSWGVQVGLPKIAGNCFKFRIDRTSPPPIITGVVSSTCIVMQPCPNTIDTKQPIVLYGPDTLCDQSVIDVPFNSTGTFNANNKYIAQLSDQNGNFGANPIVLGTSPDPNHYPVGGIPPTGNVSGLVGVTPPGCNYYIRVVSTSPPYTPPSSSYYGPFCIRQCDATTNKMKDITICIGDTVGESVTITVDINSWKKNNVTYVAGNKFLVQLLNHSNPPPYAVVNTGGLGATVATNGTSLILHVPPLDSLINILGIPLGAYYMRLISTNTNCTDTLGTLVRLTIGYADPSKPILASFDDNFNSDSVFCAGSTMIIDVLNNNEFTLGSKYQWKSSFNFGQQQPFLLDPALAATLNIGTAPGRYWFLVQEINNGCLSPWSDTLWVTVLTKPNASVTGTNPLCISDSDIFRSQFQNDTYYTWYVLGDTSRIVKRANNIITVVFDSAGTFIVIDTIINQCGSNQASKKVIVYPKPDLKVTADFGICLGKKAFIKGITTAPKFEWDFKGLVVTKDSIYSFTPDSTVKYIALATSPIGCKRKDSVTVTVNLNPLVKLTTKPVTCFGYSDGSIASLVQQGAPPYSYSWSNAAITPAIDSLLPGTYSLTVVDLNTCRDSASASLSNPTPVGVTAATTYSAYGQASGTATVIAAGGRAPYVYIWSTIPPQTGNEAIGLSPGVYSVTVSDSLGCAVSARVDITYAPNELFVPNAFSPNGDGINDQFQFSANNLGSAHVMIFNRWGEKIFETNSLEEKWDGKYKDVPVDVGVYVYVIDAVFLDGKKVSKSGNLSVLR